jgi:hypothetical protein
MNNHKLFGLRISRLLTIISLAGLVACGGAPTAPPPEQTSAEPQTAAPAEKLGPAEPMPQVSEAPPAPEKTPLRDDIPERYVVKKGDTLWDIASRFLKDPWLWPEVWHVNPEIRNPHLIYPGDVIALYYVEGKPVLTLEGAEAVPEPRPGMETVKLEPKVRVEKLEKAITTIPKDAIAPFLAAPRVVDEDTLDAAPYVISSYEGHLISGPGTVIYIHGLDDSADPSYNVVRKGEAYIDPETEEVLGYEAQDLADARIVKVGSPSTGQITKARQEVINGDYLLPVDDKTLDLNFFPRAPKQKVEGQIISVYKGVEKIGQYNMVVLNRGKRDGLKPGHVLEIYRAGLEVRDPKTGDRVQLPEEYAGVLMVVRPYEKLSYALVMEAERALRIHDKVVSP